MVVRSGLHAYKRNGDRRTFERRLINQSVTHITDRRAAERRNSERRAVRNEDLAPPTTR